jgi:hypothetical protein
MKFVPSFDVLALAFPARSHLGWARPCRIDRVVAVLQVRDRMVAQLMEYLAVSEPRVSSSTELEPLHRAV